MRIANMLLVGVVGMLAAGVATGQDLTSRVSVAYLLTPTPHVVVTNNYVSPLTGFVITVSSTAAPYRTREIIWFDSGLNFRHDYPLEPGQDYSRPVGPISQASSLQPRLKAVTFQDSSSAGDPSWLSKLHERRKAAYNEIGIVTALLNQALAQHEPNNQIISALNSTDASLRSTMPDAEARGAAQLVVYAAVSNLKRGGLQGDIGDPQKTIPLAILPLFAEWRAALQRYDKNVI